MFIDPEWASTMSAAEARRHAESARQTVLEAGERSRRSGEAAFTDDVADCVTLCAAYEGLTGRQIFLRDYDRREDWRVG